MNKNNRIISNTKGQLNSVMAPRRAAGSENTKSKASEKPLRYNLKRSRNWQGNLIVVGICEHNVRFIDRWMDGWMDR
jgi:hypothetical protein